MPDENKVLKEGEVAVPSVLLEQMQKDMAELTRKQAESEAKIAGLETLDEATDKDGVPKLRSKKSFEPEFRTVRLHKFPIAGDYDNKGYVVGWTNRGAYGKVDRTGVSPQIVNYIDIFFLDEKTGQPVRKDGKLQAESVALLDLMNSEQVHCRIVDTKREEKKVPTGEEINVSIYDPKHGLMSTGDIIDGFITYSDIDYTLQVPGVSEAVVVDAEFCNR